MADPNDIDGYLTDLAEPGQIYRDLALERIGATKRFSERERPVIAPRHAVENDYSRPRDAMSGVAQGLNPFEIVPAVNEVTKTARTVYEDARDHGSFKHLPDLGIEVAGMVVGPPAAKGVGKAMAPARQPKLDARGFYSQLDHILEGFSPKDTVTRDTLAKKGVKDAEIEARGLLPMLKQGGVKVSDLQRVAADNPVTVKESFYAGREGEGSDYHLLDWTNDEHGNRVNTYEDGRGRQYEVVEDKDAGNVSVQRLDGGEFLPIRAPMNSQRLVHGENAIATFLESEGVPKGAIGPPQFSNYTGMVDKESPTYQERVVHLAAPKRMQDIEARVKEIHNEQHNRGLQAGNPEHVARFVELNKERDGLMDEFDKLKSENFKDRHFPEVDRVVGNYMRSLETDSAGNPVDVWWQAQSTPGQRLRDAQHEAYAQKMFGRRFQSLQPEERTAISKQISADGKNALTGQRDDTKIAELQAQYDAVFPQQAEAIEKARSRLLEMGYLSEDGAAHVRDVDSAMSMSQYLQQQAGELWRKGDTDKANQLLYAKDAEELHRHREQIDNYEREANRLRAEKRSAQDGPVRHPSIANTEQWLTMVTRNALKNAIDEGAHGIALPGGETVLSYNPGKEAGMKGFYGNPETGAGIAPHVIEREFKRLVPGYEGRSITEIPVATHEGEWGRMPPAPAGSMADRLAGLFNHDGQKWERGRHNISDIAERLAGRPRRRDDGLREYEFRDGTRFILDDADNAWDIAGKEGGGLTPFHYFPITPEIKSAVAKGLPYFAMGGVALTPAVSALLKLQDDTERQ